MSDTKKTLRLGSSKLRIELDKTQVFPDDPGAGTPAMVYLGDYSATYWCAVGEGCLDGSKGERDLTRREMEWLDQQGDIIDKFLYND